VHEKGKGIRLQEPSVVAISVNDSRVMAVGDEALAMLGRAPETIEVVRPMREGVIADYIVTEAMLRYFITKVCGRFPFLKPVVMISVPVGVTSVESRAVKDAAEQAGARSAYLVPEPMAAALGAGLPVGTPTGNMVLNVGGGASEAAIISMNGIVAASSVRIGGNKLDDAVAAYVKRKHNLIIGERTAEEVKRDIGSALPPERDDEELSMEVRGRDQVTGLPRSAKLRTSEVVEAIDEPVEAIIGVVRDVLERTPPELVSDIIDRGVVMTGGGSLLRDLDVRLSEAIGVPCYVAENPIACTALGAGRALENYELIRRTMPTFGS
jgi:rod shape-determining protein MreB